jgi:hypothetical protein
MLHLAKQNLPMVSTETGMQIDCNEHSLNADSSIIASVASDSNVTASTASQSRKQPRPRKPTEDGIQIDFSNGQLQNE